jgi:hypothetical protein
MKSLSRAASPALVVFLAASATIEAASGTLKVTSFPSGAQVWVDGARTGKVAPMSISLAEGEHVVTVQIPTSGWNPDTRTVTIPAQYWSNSDYAPNPSYAWTMHLRDGDVLPVARPVSLKVWPVRRR